MTIIKALEFAAVKHRNQVRKGTNIPYIVHPVQVAAILAKYDYEDELIMAGYLHDTVEDTETTIDEIEEAFGPRVAALVAFNTETKSHTWEDRKRHTIESLQANENPDGAIVMLADKYANIESMTESFAKGGEAMWTIFKRGKEDQRWYYLSIVEALRHLTGVPLYDAYKQAAERLFLTRVEDRR
jgi:(p)ppGpp synthase/HD superfamily hydrolase